MTVTKKSKPSEYWLIILKYRKYFYRNSIAVVITAAIISLLLVHQYSATATTLPPTSDQSMMLGMFTSNMPSSIANLSRLTSGIPGLTSPSDLYAAILNSGRIKSQVIHKNNLMKEFKTKTMTDAMKALDEITTIAVSPEGIISVSITYKNKYLAADIANSFIEELDKFNTETAMTTGKKYRIFIEQRLKGNIDTLKQTEEALRSFQEEHHTIALEEEIITAIQTIAELKSQIILLEVKKGVLSSSSRFNNPYLYDINKELKEFKNQLLKIEFGDQDTIKKAFGAGFAVPFSKLPEVSLEYARLLRDVEVQSVIYELLTQQYEQAKLMELKDTPTVQFLDRASPPEKRSFPKRMKIVLFAFFLSIFGNVFLAFLFEYIHDYKANPSSHKTVSRFIDNISDDLKVIRRFFSKK
jgi:uncharacterized protein involved in exopolysaccharide biosynthesis